MKESGVTLALETTGRPQKQAMPKAAPYRLRIAADSMATLRYWHGLDELAIATPFQAMSWLATWYENASLRETLKPCLIEVLAAEDCTPLMLLPLVIAKEGAMHIARFADDGITDYNAPLLMPQAEGIDCSLLLDALRKTLPAVDMFDLDKMHALPGCQAMSSPCPVLTQSI
jgi:CelD/BcsL family acetyltransferase involved in cellulose biosynthesis